MNTDKQLLLKDLCARLPYGVIVAYKSRENEGHIKLGYGNIGYVFEIGRGWWEYCKPYLRPMSSMTEEERRDWSGKVLLSKAVFSDKMDVLYDFCNAHHLDYRGLISKSLALPAPDGMYNV